MSEAEVHYAPGVLLAHTVLMGWTGLARESGTRFRVRAQCCREAFGHVPLVIPIAVVIVQKPQLCGFRKSRVFVLGAQFPVNGTLMEFDGVGRQE